MKFTYSKVHFSWCTLPQIMTNAYLVKPSLLPLTPDNHWFVLCPYGSSFPECQRSEILCSVASQSGCSHLASRVRVAVSVRSSFLFIAELYSIVWMNHRVLLH